MRRPSRYSPHGGYPCYEGHFHFTLDGAADCDQRHWEERAKESGLTFDLELKRFPKPPQPEQTEFFKGVK